MSQHAKFMLIIMLATPQENVVLDMCAQRRFRSDCAYMQSDQNLHWAHFESKVVFFSHGQQRLSSDCADAQADLSLRWVHMSEGTFSHATAHILLYLAVWMHMGLSRYMH